MLESCPINLETAVSPMAPEFKRADQHGTDEKAMLKKKQERTGKICLEVAVFIEYCSKAIIR